MTSLPRSSESEPEQPQGERLQKALARAGVASRRASEELIKQGRVAVNGTVTKDLGVRVDLTRDEVTVDGNTVSKPALAYLALNKPRGYLTSLSDPHHHKTIADLIPREPAGLFPVGRLDLDSEGLLLITNDGDLAFRLLHPSFHVEKTYMVVVGGVPTETELERLRVGVVLDDGVTKPADVELLGKGGKTSQLRICISEGRKRQVRRMFGHIGHAVVSLRRVSFGPVPLGDLPLGETRPLTAEEVSALMRDAGME